MKIRYIAMGVVAAFGMSGAAHAIGIDGSIGFSGAGSTWAYDGTCTNVANCNGFTITPGAPAMNIEVDTVDGDFDVAGSQVGDLGTMKNVNVNNLPIAAQWTMGIFTFDLEVATINGVTNNCPNFCFLNMTGKGTVNGAGFDPTPGIWSWTGTSTGTSFTFAPTTTTRIQAPEPGTLALLGLGLVGLGFGRRRRV